MNNMIETVVEWLEVRGIEAEVDYDNEEITYMDDYDEVFIFCYLNEVSLQRVIDNNDMYHTNEIN